MSGVQLVVTPTNLRFHAPFTYFQKRLITLLNPSDMAMIYSIHKGDDKNLSIDNLRGRIEPFDTTEITVTLEAFEGDLPVPCSLEVRSISEGAIDKEEEGWNSIDVKIEMEPAKNFHSGDELLRMRLKPEDLAKTIEEQYRPVCSECSKAPQQPPVQRSWLTRFILILVVSTAAYFSYDTLGLGSIFSLESERIV